jgi:hypothetical protein
MPEDQKDDLEARIEVHTHRLEEELRAAHPRFAAYLDMTIQPRKLWGGGYDLLGETYPDLATAMEAQRAAVMHKLLEAERQQ